MNILVSLVVGLLFGLGIILGGMSNPAKVQAFLDLGGNWDPSLALVMGGAIAVGLIAFRMAGRRTSTLLGDPMQLPGNKQIDRRLLVGSGLFGIGWGLAGICPGPALTLLGTGASKGIIFMLAMLAGMLLFEIYQRRQTA
jgi:uncharacterized protein